MKKIALILVAAIFFIACDKHEHKVFDGVGDQNLVAFNSSASSLPVLVNGVGSVDITIDISQRSAAPRTIQVSIDASKTTAASENYTIVNPIVTVPANAHNAVITVEGTDVSVETTATILALVIDSIDGGALITPTIHEVSIFQICPVDDTFATGNYLIEQLSAYVDGPTLDDGSIVAITNEGGVLRKFNTAHYPDYCSSGTFEFNLVCGEVVVPNQDSTCSCGSGADWFTAANTNETFDVNDDSIILVTFTDDTQANCGAPTQTTYRLTKQ